MQIMTAGVAIAVLLLTTITASLIAAYYKFRCEAMYRKMMRSDEVAATRWLQMQDLQMQVDTLTKSRSRR